MQSQPATTDLSGLYDGDFFEWTRRNAELLRAGQVRQSDIQHIAEAIEDLGKQDLKELHRRARALLAHLLVGQLQPVKHAHWRLAPVTEERIWLDGLLEQSPSLKMILGTNCRYTTPARCGWRWLWPGLPRDENSSPSSVRSPSIRSSTRTSCPGYNEEAGCNRSLIKPPQI